MKINHMRNTIDGGIKSNWLGKATQKLPPQRQVGPTTVQRDGSETVSSIRLQVPIDMYG